MPRLKQIMKIELKQIKLSVNFHLQILLEHILILNQHIIFNHEAIAQAGVVQQQAKPNCPGS